MKQKLPVLFDPTYPNYIIKINDYAFQTEILLTEEGFEMYKKMDPDFSDSAAVNILVMGLEKPIARFDRANFVTKKLFLRQIEFFLSWSNKDNIEEYLKSLLPPEPKELTDGEKEEGLPY